MGLVEEGASGQCDDARQRRRARTESYISDSIYLLQPDASLLEVKQAPCGQERDLQDLLDAHPELIPGAQINPDVPLRWLVIRSEAGVPSEETGGNWWSLDHLLIDQEGVPTFVEVKRATDTRIRREVVAQMLEYAANGTAYWRVDTLQAWFQEAETKAGRVHATSLEAFVEGGTVTVDEFWNRVAENLQAGRVRLVFVADSIPATLRRLVEFLNEHLNTVEVLAVEVPQYVSSGSDGVRALVPRLVGQTEKARAAKGGSPAPVRRATAWTTEQVLHDVEQRTPQHLPALDQLIEWGDNQPCVSMRGGTGPNQASLQFLVDTGRDGRPELGVLTVFGGEAPQLELRLQDMLLTPPYGQSERRTGLLDALQQLEVLRRRDRMKQRPNVPLAQLTSDVIRTILAIIDRWIDDVRSAASEPDEADADGADTWP